MPREGSLAVAYHSLRRGEVPTYDSLMRRADLLDDFTDTLAFGSAAPKEELAVHPSNEVFVEQRQMVVNEIRNLTETVGNLCHGGPVVYNARTCSVALAYLDTLLNRELVPREYYQVVALSCVLIAVKTVETVMPPLTRLRPYIHINLDALLAMEVQVLKSLNMKTHVMTTWDYLLCWVDVLRELPDASLPELAIIATPTAEGEHGYGELSVTYLDSLVTSSSLPLLPSEATLAVLGAVPFKCEDVLELENLNQYAPNTYDYCLVCAHQFARFPPSIVALCCLLVGVQRGWMAKHQQMQIPIDTVRSLAAVESDDDHIAAAIAPCFAAVMLEYCACPAAAQDEATAPTDVDAEAAVAEAAAASYEAPKQRQQTEPLRSPASTGSSSESPGLTPSYESEIGSAEWAAVRSPPTAQHAAAKREGSVGACVPPAAQAKEAPAAEVLTDVPTTYIPY